MVPNDRLQRLLASRQLGGSKSLSVACVTEAPEATIFNDLRLFALTFAGGFLFTSVFLA